ncbi:MULTISPECIES: hypothetical protein [unclassified Pseudomonas]|uniref:hypothetical protein n=1 Tax=unclassified Pseudomonas TaxID=196821 RepID=UPI003807EB1C
MNVASASLCSAEALLGDLVAEGDGTHLAYAAQVLIREAKALIDASVLSVELAEVAR